MIGRFASVALAALAVCAPMSVRAEPVTATYDAAIACAAAFAETSSLSRDAIEALPGEALEHCAEGQAAAIREVAAALPDQQPALVNDWVSAKMRVAAADVVILRLERGEYPGAPTAMRELVDPAARLMFCMRVALGREMEGLFFGAEWPINLSGQSQAQISAAFIEIGQRNCPRSDAAFVRAFEQRVGSLDREARRIVTNDFNPSAVRAIAVEPYLRVVPD